MFRLSPLRTVRIQPFVRNFGSTAARFEGSTSATTAAPIAPKKPVGAFRGGIIGFLFGFSFVGAYAYLHLLDEYKSASNLLLLSVEELKSSTTKLVSHIRRIEDLEKEVNQLKSKSTSQEEIEKLRNHVQSLHEGATMEILGVKSYLLGIEKDVQQLTKKESSSVEVK